MKYTDLRSSVKLYPSLMKTKKAGICINTDMKNKLKKVWLTFIVRLHLKWQFEISSW